MVVDGGQTVSVCMDNYSVIAENTVKANVQFSNKIELNYMTTSRFSLTGKAALKTLGAAGLLEVRHAAALLECECQVISYRYFRL